MTNINVTAGPFRFLARLEHELAPQTVAHFITMLPLRTRIIHARWSGEACWIPMGDTSTHFAIENATSYPAPGQFIFYPGGLSETEILLAYGGVRFASNVGQLAGNHFLTIVEGEPKLIELGRLALWHGAQELVIDHD